MTNRWIQQIFLFVLCLGILLLTMVPTIYTLDSAEFTVGAATLGIVHGPGYPLYLVLAHATTWLPVGDIAYRVNLFSALCLALTAPCLYGLLDDIVQDRWIALCVTLCALWSRSIWLTGLFAEVYGPQLLTLAACGWWLAHGYRAQVSTSMALLGGLLVGLTLAMAPSSVFFVFGLVIVFLKLRISWRDRILAAGVSLIVFVVPLIYFPIRYAAQPDFNLAGVYNAEGQFKAVDLGQISNIIWLLRGGQFDSLFFANGFFPLGAFLRTIRWLWANYLGMGLILGFIGCFTLYRTKRGLLWIWLLFTLPYVYFYSTYGAPDRQMMMGPFYLLWTVPIAYGLQWGLSSAQRRQKMITLLLLPIILLAVNFPLLDLSDEHHIRTYSQTLLDGLPPNAHVFGVWWEIVPLQYLQVVEHKRPDVRLYNLFQFNSVEMRAFVDDQLATNPDEPIIFLTTARTRLDETQYTFIPLAVNDVLLENTEGYVAGYQVYPAGVIHE
jgi:hypothetical protein